MHKMILASLMLSTSAMAADLDYYDEVPQALTGPPAVVRAHPVPVPGVSVPLPIAPPPPPVPILPACGPEGVGSLQIVGNLRSWPPADALTVRDGPGVEYAPLGVLFEGAPVVVCGAFFGWGRLQSGGWVSLRYLIPVQ